VFALKHKITCAEDVVILLRSFSGYGLSLLFLSVFKFETEKSKTVKN